MSRVCSYLKCCSCLLFIVLCVLLLIVIIVGTVCNRCCKNIKSAPKISSVKLLSNKNFLSDKEYICCDESITFLPDNYFLEGKKLKRIDFMGDILSIEENAFAECCNVEEINFYGKVNYYSKKAFKKLKNLKRIYFKELSIIYENTFSNLTELKSVTVKQGLQDIENGAFFGCGNLENFNTQNICLYYCNKTKDAVVIPNYKHCLPTWTFSFCSSVESITIHNNVIFIKPHCFSACDKLTVIQYTDTLENFKTIFPSFFVELKGACVIKTSDNQAGIKVEDIVAGK